MAVIASLVVGINNATSKGGSSRPLSTPADRARFLQRHRSAAAFIIGKKTAAIEDYSKTGVPIFVLTRSPEALELTNPLIEQVNVEAGLADAVLHITTRITGDVVVEAGQSLLLELSREGLIDVLELTISPIVGDGDYLDLQKLLSYFVITSDLEVDGTRLLECRNKRDSTDCESNS